MLDKREVERVVDLQVKSYNLLTWMASAVTEGFIGFDRAHEYGTLPEAASAWILNHYCDIPIKARPDKQELPAFSNLFSTYLQNSFDLLSNPGKRRYSPDAHCFCPMCSWLVDAPNLKSKKVMPADKRQAQRMKKKVVVNALVEIGSSLSEREIGSFMAGPEVRESLSILAYAHDLLDRTKGFAAGPAALVLWRGFAWTPKGSPKKNFRLSAQQILDGEADVYRSLSEAASEPQDVAQQ